MRFTLLILFGCFSLHRMLSSMENDFNHQSYVQNLNPSKLLDTNQKEDDNKKNLQKTPIHFFTGSMPFFRITVRVEFLKTFSGLQYKENSNTPISAAFISKCGLQMWMALTIF